MRLSIAVIAMSNLPSMRLVSWNTELGVGVIFTSRPFLAKRPFSCATQIGQLKPPGKTITLTIWVAQEKGLFAKNGLEGKITPTPSSVFQLTNLIDGKFDIAMTAIDNLIAYREGQGEVPRLGPDLFAFMGCDNGFLRLVTLPEAKSLGGL